MGRITIAAVYLLILVGGVVRASGSGMGCPDWPKCFGQWVPPTDVSQLPSNYQEIYAHRGYADTEFNAVKTWIEYLNRLLGAVIGLLIFATMLLSISFWRADKQVLLFTILSFILVGFNGWLGSVVVATNLRPVTITIHMVAALLVVGTLIYAVARSRADAASFGSIRPSKLIPWLIALTILLSLAQLLLGTQVREHVDELAKLMGESSRAQWSESFGRTFYIHRSLSIAIFLANAALAFVIVRRTHTKGGLVRSVYALMGLIGAEIIAGMILYYGGMPASFQPVHLLLGALLYGVQFYIAIAYGFARNSASATAP